MCREEGWEGWKVATAPHAPAWDLNIYHTKSVSWRTVCRDDPEKSGGHIKSAQMTRSKFVC